MRFFRYPDPLDRPAWCLQRPDGTYRSIQGSPYGRWEEGPEMATPARLLAPVEPWAIIGIALNYRAHAAETGKPAPERPVFFVKLPGAVQHPGASILLPRQGRGEAVDYEGELAVIIGQTCRNVPRQLALDYVAGYTCANDVSARDWQFQWGGGQFCRGKTFDTFCPLGPCLVTPAEIPDPSRLLLRTRRNGEVVQESPVSDLIFDVPTLISFLSQSTTLQPGTVILTGTPSGVGHARRPPVYLRAGDSVTVEIEGIGALTNPVADEPGD